jgi:hypothetical protein
MQTTAHDWHDGAERFQAEGHPQYTEFLAARKEQCGGRGYSFIREHELWLSKQDHR